MANNVFRFPVAVTARIIQPVIFAGRTIPSKSKVMVRGFRSDGVLVAEPQFSDKEDIEEFPLEFKNCKPKDKEQLKEQLTSVTRMTDNQIVQALVESLSK